MSVTPRTLGRILIDQASRRGSEPFLLFEDDVTSYAELLGQAASVRAGLAAAGLEPGDRVGLLLPNRPEFLQAWFGAALRGLVVVPVNPAYKPDEIRFILGDAGARAVITTDARVADIDAIASDLPALETRIVVGDAPSGWGSFADVLATDAFAGEARDPGSVDDDADVEDAAAIIYTSGTTGHPKGVVLTHHNYCHDTWSLTEHLGCDESDRFLCFLPLYHVNAQVVSVLSAAYVGGALILLEQFSPAAFLESVARYKATTFSAVPTVYAILNTLEDAARYDLSSLRYCVCGAAPMPVEVFTTFEAKYGAKIVEGYGLSEATCGNCVNPLREGAERKIGSIGVPLPGQEMAIVGDDGTHLGTDEVGEIAIRGPMVMREYFGNPDATRAALVDGWLLTGDLGRRDTDGYYFIVGRKKEMIIRGGANIYPKEIEEVIYTHPSVQEAAVVGVADEIWGEVVVACVVPKPGAAVDGDAILVRCREKLADYKVPTRVVACERFPKTPTGKIQKNRIDIPAP